jgi:hypothetical protein
LPDEGLEELELPHPANELDNVTIRIASSNFMAISTVANFRCCSTTVQTDTSICKLLSVVRFRNW